MTELSDHDRELGELQAIEEAWFQTCASCDAGLPFPCTCPTDDPRNVIAALVERVRALIEARNEAQAAVGRVEALCVTVENRMMATAKPSEIRRALGGSGEGL